MGVTQQSRRAILRYSVVSDSSLNSGASSASSLSPAASCTLMPARLKQGEAGTGGAAACSVALLLPLVKKEEKKKEKNLQLRSHSPESSLPRCVDPPLQQAYFGYLLYLCRLGSHVMPTQLPRPPLSSPPLTSARVLQSRRARALQLDCLQRCARPRLLKGVRLLSLLTRFF